jgi:hypothetical protein
VLTLGYALHVAFDPEHLRSHARRPWVEQQRAKREWVAERHRDDPGAHVASIEALREHVRLVRPDWPTPADLERDLADHIALKRKLDRAGAWLAARDRRR